MELYIFLDLIGKTDKEAEEIMEEKVSVDYFGNIVGVNNYRDYDTVVVLKTPNFGYLDYVLQYDFLNPQGTENDDVALFKHEKIEKLRHTTIAGEIYQALKRINRDNSKPAQYIVFTTNDEAVDLVVREFPKIKFYKKDIHVDYRAKKKEQETKTAQRQQAIKEYLLKCKESGKEVVTKKEIRNHIQYHDKKNFSKLLCSIDAFLISQNMTNHSRCILIHDNQKLEI